ncbi:MAG TPA: RidA family protein [Sphingobacteriaceae bacterium]|nr:RidA family protein [Sphingobacteriaceae bacterium]
MSLEQRLREMGLELPAVPAPVAAYIPGVRSGQLIFTSGQLPMVQGELRYKGRLGENLTVEEGYEAARICALNALAVVKELAGDLAAVERIVKVVGYVNSTDDFTQQPQVINGASELLGELLGEAGRHARAAVGVNTLPLGAAVELEMIVQVRAQ